jgi:hypothetical protein
MNGRRRQGPVAGASPVTTVCHSLPRGVGHHVGTELAALPLPRSSDSSSTSAPCAARGPTVWSSPPVMDMAPRKGGGSAGGGGGGVAWGPRGEGLTRRVRMLQREEWR